MKRKKKLLIAMALERTYQYKPDFIHINATCHILAVQMRSCNYTPFLNEFGSEWRERIAGYSICGEFQDIIIEYAKQFLTQQK
jgi:hypothetical protein